MDVYERNTCSFIVKVWVDPNTDSTGQPRWRGHVTHVFTGQRQYFEDLVTLVKFITLYLERMGVSSAQSERHVETPS
ncbi:MAG: hypothetical protein R3E79_38925 [Caldilineaceae bacterium]